MTSDCVIIRLILSLIPLGDGDWGAAEPDQAVDDPFVKKFTLFLFDDWVVGPELIGPE